MEVSALTVLHTIPSHLRAVPKLGMCTRSGTFPGTWPHTEMFDGGSLTCGVKGVVPSSRRGVSQRRAR